MCIACSEFDEIWCEKCGHSLEHCECEDEDSKPKCKKCGSTDIIFGKAHLMPHGSQQTIYCNKCDARMELSL